MALIVTIGRNLGKAAGSRHGQPMGAAKWRGFRDAAKAIVLDAGLTLYFHGEGSGIWEDQVEESYTLISSEPLGMDLILLGVKLRLLCREYQQDAIAVTTGQTVFLEPRS